MSDLLGVPFSSQKPEILKGELAFDAYELLMGISSFIASFDEQLASSKLMKLTRDRLKKMRANQSLHHEIMSRLLAPLNPSQLNATEYSRLVNRKKNGHRLIEYYSHLCKDWTWGGREAEAALAMIQRVSGGMVPPKRVLSLGAGACRLPYEIHRWLRPDLSVCADLNPLLLSCAQKVTRGEVLSLVEFPVLPKDANSFSVVSELRAPEVLASGFDFLVHDILEWGFLPSSFDLVVTPWFIDVCPIPFPRLATLINSVLKPGGYWINFGPLGFNKLNLAEFYSLEEVLHIVKRSGFNMHGQVDEPTPHMQSPHSGHWRVDRVLAFCAKKETDCEILADEGTPPFPSWLDNLDEPIQMPESLAEMQSTLGFTLDLAMKAEGGLSIRELARLMSARHAMPLQAAESLIRSTLKIWLATGRYNPTK